MKIYIGTSGWSYPKGEGTWNVNFYPPGKVNELEYYCRFFDAVEVNSTFYRPPDHRVTARWAQQVPDGFRFAIKLWQKFTHPKTFEAATGEAAAISLEDVTRFRKGIEPLVESGKLGVLLAQFPPSFRNDRDGQRIIAAVINSFSDYSLAVELRHRSWSDDPSTASFLKRYNVAWVQIDEPKFSSSIAEELPNTADIGYFRFHGRNAENWWSGDNETRYKYLYSITEIDELSRKVRITAQRANLVFAFFNNHWKGWAPRNAMDMLKSLQLPFTEPLSFGGGLFANE